MADKGDKGEPTDQYVIRTTKIASGDPNLPAGGLKIEILKNDSVIEVSYIANGTSGVTYINYELDGGSFSQKPTVDLTFGNKLTLAKPNKNHYTFMGWYNNNSFSGEEITEVKSDGTKSTITLYAKFLPNLQVTYETNGGTFTTTPKSEFKVGETLSTIINPKKEHFTFMGWYSIKNFSGEEVKELKSDGSKSSVTLYAKWLPNMQVTFETNGGTFATNPKSEFEVGETLSTTILKQEHYTFMGWYNNSSFSGQEVKEIISNGTQSSVTLYAKWLPNMQVTYETNGGTFATTPKSEFDVGETFVPITPAKEHFTFMGWYFENDFSGKEIKEYKSNGTQSSITLYAKWLPNMQVTYITNGGTFATTPKSEFEIGEMLDSIIPEREYYTFLGWYYEENCTGNAVTRIEYDSEKDSVTLYALWRLGVTLNKLENYLYNFTPQQEPYIISLIGDINFNTLNSILRNTPSGIYIDLSLPDSVTKIDDQAFYDCDNLSSITIPNSVTSIGDSAFYSCGNLSSITIPNSVTSIGDSAFYSCGNLSSITIPNSVTSIGDSAFRGCGNLSSITIPNSVTSIGDSAFYYCSRLSSITIPNSVTSIGDSAFYDCDNLSSITIPNRVTSIGDSAFYDCDNLSSITIPNRVTSIGDSAFYSCGNLTSITIPSSVTSIGDSAFYSCGNLSSITIPGSVTSIGDSAFYDCDNLSSITIPGSVTSIGDSAFYNCDNLSSITILDSVTSIGDSAFFNCGNLSSVTIPGSVTSIGNSAFRGCGNLSSVTISDGVTSIGDYTFTSCGKLSSITIPGSVTSIGDSAFLFCTQLTSITIPNGVTSIGDRAFESCDLTSINIPASVTFIGKDILSHCSNITQIIVDSQNPKYDSRNNCNAIIETATNTLLRGCNATIIPDGVTSIGDSAFSICENLTSLIIPASVTSIGEDVFFGCENLEQIQVNPQNPKYDSRNNCNAIIETATNTLLRGCYKTVIPNSVTSIEDDAFSFSYKLTTITIPNGVTSLGNNLFYFCNLTSITIPSSVTSIGLDTFYGCYSLTTINYTGTEEQWNKLNVNLPITPVINFNYIPPTE